jgi:hypothetical protein
MGITGLFGRASTSIDGTVTTVLTVGLPGRGSGARCFDRGVILHLGHRPTRHRGVAAKLLNRPGSQYEIPLSSA